MASSTSDLWLCETSRLTRKDKLTPGDLIFLFLIGNVLFVLIILDLLRWFVHLSTVLFKNCATVLISLYLSVIKNLFFSDHIIIIICSSMFCAWWRDVYECLWTLCSSNPFSPSFPSHPFPHPLLSLSLTLTRSPITAQPGGERDRPGSYWS